MYRDYINEDQITNINEPEHDKNNKNDLCTSEDSHQLGHSKSSLYTLRVAKDPYLLLADSED